MPKFNVAPLVTSVRSVETSTAAANVAIDDMKAKHDRAIVAIREFNASREATRTAFETAARDAETVRVAANDVASTLATIPDAIPEPTSSEPPVSGEEVLVRGRRVG